MSNNISQAIQDIKIFVAENQIKSDVTNNKYIDVDKLNKYLNERLKVIEKKNSH